MSKKLEYIQQKLNAYDQWIRVHFVGSAFIGESLADRYGIMSAEFEDKLQEHMNEVAKLKTQKEMVDWFRIVLEEASEHDNN